MEDRDVKKLFDDELDKVTGGVREDNPTMETYGMSIKCPNAGCPSRISKIVHEDNTDPNFHSYLYHCDSCGTSFVIFKNRMILKEKWIEECKTYKHMYPFANL